MTKAGGGFITIPKMPNSEQGPYYLSGRVLLAAPLVGVVAGIGSIIFFTLCQLGMFFFLNQLAGYQPSPPRGEPPLFEPILPKPFSPLFLALSCVIGGLLSGLLVFMFAPEAEGHGTDTVIEAYHRKRGLIRSIVPLIKTVASALTLSSGGSGGREGPIALIGAGFGSALANRFRFTERERRILVAAGMGAGIGSIFRAPMAGALFSAEVLYSDPEFETDVIIPSTISSIVAYCIFSLRFGWGNLFVTPQVDFTNVLELVPYTFLGFVVAFFAMLYIKAFYTAQKKFQQLPITPHLKPAIGALGTAIVGLGLYYLFGRNRDTLSVFSFGYGIVQKALDGHGEILILLAIAAGKILTTSLSIGSGGSGGVFGPSMVIGGSLGAAVGLMFYRLMPNVVSHPASFVIVGMAGFFAGAANTPISTIIMVSEMTGNYNLLLPAMWVCSISYILTRNRSIYCQQTPSRIDSPAHRGEFILDILEEMKVKDILIPKEKIITVPENMWLRDVWNLVAETNQTHFPVLDATGQLSGVFTLNDIRNVLYEQELATLVIVKDFANWPVITVTPNENLSSAMRKFTLKNIESLPVVDEENPRKLLGIITRRDLIAAYNKKLMELRQEG